MKLARVASVLAAAALVLPLSPTALAGDGGSAWSCVAAGAADLGGVEVRMVGQVGREPGCTELGMVAGLPSGTTWTLGTTDPAKPLPTDLDGEACRFVGLGGVELAVLDADGAPGAGPLCVELGRGLPLRPMLDPAWSLSTDAITLDGRTITLPLDGGSASATVPFAAPEPIVHGRGSWSAEGTADLVGIGCLHGDLWLVGVMVPAQSMWAVMRWDLTPDPGTDEITMEAIHPVLLDSPMPLETRCGLTAEGHPTIAGSSGTVTLGSFTADDVVSAGTEAVMLLAFGSGGSVTFEDVVAVRPWIG